jgi:anthranilate phosphoribosyltransferase
VSFARYIKELGCGAEGRRDLSESEAYQLWSALMDGGVPDLEMGAILMAFRLKTETPEEFRGFIRATNERLTMLEQPSQEYRPLVIASYNGTRHQANLLPLLALLLQQYGVPVLIHGMLDGNGRVATAYVLRELGILPCASSSQANRALEESGIAFVPAAVLSVGLADLMALRGRLGIRNSAHGVAKLVDPFAGQGVLMVGATYPDYLALIGDCLVERNGRSLLLKATEGEAFADPRQRPALRYFSDGIETELFEAEGTAITDLPGLPLEPEAAPTALWIRKVLGGDLPLPHPLANQLACCLFASGYTEDMNQAKAIAAMRSRRLSMP